MLDLNDLFLEFDKEISLKKIYKQKITRGRDGSVFWRTFLIPVYKVNEIYKSEVARRTLNMVSYEKIISNFTKILDETEAPLFAPPTEEQLEKLRQLVGNKVPKFIDFYEKYEPQHGFPTLDCYLNLLDIDDILTENQDGEPGEHLAKYGVFVFATTVGGDLVCIDANNCKDGDPAVLVASHTFCSYNYDLGCFELYDVPDSFSDEY